MTNARCKTAEKALARDQRISPVAALRQLHAHLRDGKAISPDAAALIADGIEDWLDFGCRSLDKSLGLKAWGGVPAEKADRLDRRNMLLRRLHQTSLDWQNLSPTAAGAIMAMSAKRYTTTRWPRESDAPSAPAAEPAATWWRVLTLGVSIPGAKMFAKILSE
ncbi:hypothetical protein [Shinella sp.]|uniref:hypothetical protein n=1 Tax=Shinella sp. TaxID=1870904 RepID=UPI0040350C3A